MPDAIKYLFKILSATVMPMKYEDKLNILSNKQKQRNFYQHTCILKMLRGNYLVKIKTILEKKTEIQEEI